MLLSRKDRSQASPSTLIVALRGSDTAETPIGNVAIRCLSSAFVAIFDLSGCADAAASRSQAGLTCPTTATNWSPLPTHTARTLSLCPNRFV